MLLKGTVQSKIKKIIYDHVIPNLYGLLLQTTKKEKYILKNICYFKLLLEMFKLKILFFSLYRITELQFKSPINKVLTFF